MGGGECKRGESDLQSWIDRCAQSFEGDDVQSWMFVFPAFAVACALGFPADDAQDAAHATATLVRGTSANAGLGEVRRASAAAQKINSDVKGLFAKQSRTPLLSAFADEAARLGVADNAIATNTVGFLFQTLDATAALIGNALPALLHAPNLERGDTGAFISDVARFDPPAHSTRRYAAANVEIFDCHIATRDTVLVLLAAANQEPAAPSFTFGSGPHRCPAQTVAITLAKAAVASVVERLPSFAELPHSGVCVIAVIFEVRPNSEHRQTYLDIAAELLPVLRTIPGFISIERFRSLADPAKILSLSLWRDEQAVTRWSNSTARRNIKGARTFLKITACALQASFATTA